MVLSHMLRVLRRRWILAVLGILLTSGLAALTPRVVPPEYAVTASVLLLPPVRTSEPGANPYLSLGGLTGPTEVLARALADPVVAKELKAAGASGEYTVARDFNTSAPVLVVTAQDKTVVGATRTTDLVLERLPRTLRELQASINVAPEAMITSAVINHDAKPEILRKPLIRALLLVVVAGLVLTLTIAGIVDGILIRRPSRRRRTVHRADPPRPATSEPVAASPRANASDEATASERGTETNGVEVWAGSVEPSR